MNLVIKKIKQNKLKTILLFLILIFYTPVHLNLFEAKKYLYEYFPNLELRKYVFSKKKLENLHNDYNVKFLPDTQFLRFDSKIINLELNPNKKKIL